MKGKAKSKFNFNINPATEREFGCEYEDNGWCNLPKNKRCADCIRAKDGSKACLVII